MSSSRDTLEYEPTWVVAAVCTVIVVISLAVERFIHYLGKFLKRKKQDALVRALEKLKEELMLLGFISLLLTVFQGLISHVCVPESFVSHMLPCEKESALPTQETYDQLGLYNGQKWNTRRLLSEVSGADYCTSKDEKPLLSLEALHQLHIFIFVLAVVHVIFSASTMVLGGAKIRQWKHWEKQIQRDIPKQDIEAAQKPASEHHEFVKERAIGFWRRSAVVSWIISFVKQFHDSVSKSDYRALRAGFIMTHWPRNPKFDFHDYMMRALEDDFKKVVGISWYLWLFVVIFLLLNINGWHTYFWLSFLPLLLLLIVGAKLEHIITRLAQEVAEKLNDKTHDALGVRVRPSDEHFWFQRPRIALYLIHFILFQNSFEIAFFFWIWTTYGFDSCIMESIGYLIPRLVIGVLIQVLCSYSTLPLYAIVTQMGGTYKAVIFNESTKTPLQDWAEEVRQRKKRSSLPSLWGLFRRKHKEQSLSATEVQVVRMQSEYSGISRNFRPPADLGV
ncbi:MLO-like protein 13 isoform X1 [Ananas comosus]|uniref:MLO-like protein n=2 Tax=Ananas comosus TaxID=4615 RepID=A0A6P5GP26_ANACO|nr:MLO-like protein 13 isoform X1 [Ananas comosus]